jgi:hypothetical protein
MANYREGAFTPITEWYGRDRGSYPAGHPLANPYAHIRAGDYDWDNLASVQSMRLRASRSVAAARTRQAFTLDGPDYQLSESRGGIPLDNPYYSQGLGPRTYEGLYQSDITADDLRWAEATERKFLLRERELQGIASAPAAGGFSAGTQDAYEEQQAARRLLGKPFPEAARAAELLRQERGPRSRTVGGQPGASRQTSRAGSAERRRLGTNRSASGGSVSRKRLRAANLLGQPLGGGSQSAAQVLG